MTDTRIVKLYNIMDAQEKKGLQLWLTHKMLWSQKKGNNEDIIYLHNCLLKYAKRPNKLNDSIKKFKKPKLSQLTYQLFHVAENFLLVNWLTKNAEKKQAHNIQKQMWLLAYYQDKELPNNSKHIGTLSKLIEFKLAEIGNQLEKASPDNIDHYYQLHKYYHHLYYGLNTQIWQKGSEYLEKLFLNLDTFYVLTKMRYNTEVMYRGIVVNENFTASDVEWISNKVVNLIHKFEQLDEKNPLLKLYHLFIDLSLNVNKEQLVLLANKVIEHAHLLNEKELGTFITFVINYATFIARKEGIDLIEIHYKMLKLGLEQSVFLSNGILRPQILVNYAYLCCEKKQAEEIEFAWEKYQFRIEIDYKEATFNLCNALKSLAQNDFKQAIYYIKQGAKRDFGFYIAKKIIQLKCHYEMKDYDNLDEERLNLLKYLRKNKGELNTYAHKFYFNFTQVLRELVKPTIDKNLLLSKIEIHTAEKRWLLKKIKEK